MKIHPGILEQKTGAHGHIWLVLCAFTSGTLCKDHIITATYWICMLLFEVRRKQTDVEFVSYNPVGLFIRSSSLLLLYFVVADFTALANAGHIRHNSSFAPNSYRYMFIRSIGIAWSLEYPHHYDAGEVAALVRRSNLYVFRATVNEKFEF
jgi:hypothetical protein